MLRLTVILLQVILTRSQFVNHVEPLLNEPIDECTLMTYGPANEKVNDDKFAGIIKAKGFVNIRLYAALYSSDVSCLVGFSDLTRAS